jgi:hypothetical protein
MVLVERRERFACVRHLASILCSPPDGTTGTLWCVEALTRAGQYDPALLQKAVNMFEVRAKILFALSS